MVIHSLISVQERLRKMANRGKLLDMVKGQGEELTILREELERAYFCRFFVCRLYLI